MIDNKSLFILLFLSSLVWLSGFVLLFILQQHPYSRPKVKQLWPLLLSQAAVLSSVFLTAVIPDLLVFFVLLFIALRITYEAIVVARLDNSRETLFSMLRLIAFPFLPLVAFCLFWVRSEWRPTLVMVVVLVEIFDSFSLLGGKLFGRRLLIPSISPNKTVEGLCCGLLALSTLGTFFTLAVKMDFIQISLIIPIVAFSAFVGDVAASLRKRSSGVKDFPPILEIQGGLLDITDSWIVACPVVIGAIFVLNILGAR